MGNCQAIDNATIVIQHPNGTKIDKLLSPVAASEIMKMNPGHYVALLLTTTLYSGAAATAAKDGGAPEKNIPVRVTRIKLLRPTDTLLLGHVYRLVTNQEVMKGLLAKKQAKMQQQQKTDVNKTGQVKQERHRSKNNTSVNSATSKSRAWQPALKSISESAS